MKDDIQRLRDHLSHELTRLPKMPVSFEPEDEDPEGLTAEEAERAFAAVAARDSLLRLIMDQLEQMLAPPAKQLDPEVVGQTLCQIGTRELLDELVAIQVVEGTLAAIKFFRTMTGTSLRNARDAVEGDLPRWQGYPDLHVLHPWGLHEINGGLTKPEDEVRVICWLPDRQRALLLNKEEHGLGVLAGHVVKHFLAKGHLYVLHMREDFTMGKDVCGIPAGTVFPSALWIVHWHSQDGRAVHTARANKNR